MPWRRCFGSNRLAWMALRLPALKADTKTRKAMNTPAAKAKGMKPETNTMKTMKTPAAKAKGIKPTTLPLAGMKTPAAKAKDIASSMARSEIIIDGAIRLTTPPRQDVIDVETACEMRAM